MELGSFDDSSFFWNEFMVQSEYLKLQQTQTGMSMDWPFIITRDFSHEGAERSQRAITVDCALRAPQPPRRSPSLGGVAIVIGAGP